MGYSNKQMVEARIEEILFCLDVIENNEKAKIVLLQKIDDLMELIKEKYYE